MTYMSMLAGFAVGILTGVVGCRFFIRTKILPKLNSKAAASCSPVRRSSEETKMVVVVRTDVQMGKGKIAAQTAHAAVGCYRKAGKRCPDILSAWEYVGQPKIVLKLEPKDSSEEALESLKDHAEALGIVAKVIHDAGRTQIASGTATVVGIGPGPIYLIDKVTGHLKLM